ncbi:Gfo/Idh/MocA family protein [Salisediminibacterium halotolerans]|uniref:Gfo/Idh/MocA family protein n=1 Tax=Salisediminibacterium halotolerans TaxID=517425 RepID=UPI00116ADDBD|nr:Gfo/Idh/MocA family oxidoreductase [Salisediminibacterium halotolerans]GEL09154.1 dehydrogenase [Salisediminibacterium halotolerans]
MKTKKPVTLALVGAWHVHTNGFIKEFQKTRSEAAVFKRVWDTDPERGQRFAKMLQATWTPDFSAIFNDPEIDGVMIEAETSRHKELIQQAAAAGKHIFTDKILAPSVSEAEDILAHTNKAGIVCCVSHESLTRPDYRYAKRLMDEGWFGDVVSYYFRRSHGHAKTDRLPSSWFDPATAGGGALIDLGVHGISLAVYLFGEPDHINSHLRSLVKKNVEDTATVSMTYQHLPVIAVSHTNLVSSVMDNYLEIIGTDGSLYVIGDRDPELTLYDKHGEKSSVSSADLTETDLIPLIRWIDVLTGTDTETSLHEAGLSFSAGVSVVRTVSAAYQNSRP